jgi:hypothetical protein
MTHVRFVGELIRQSAEIWKSDHVDICDKPSAPYLRVRVAIANVAYSHGCTSEDVLRAFGWRESKRREYGPTIVTRRHAEELLRCQVYSARSETLERFGQEVLEKQRPS